MLPGSMIVYSNILPRRIWRYPNNTNAMERTRKRLNRGLRTYLLHNNSCAIAHPDFDDSYSALYDDDVFIYLSLERIYLLIQFKRPCFNF